TRYAERRPQYRMPKDPSAKSSWPLLTLAALSFIPILGFFIAAVALPWALRSNRPRSRLAGILAGVAAVLQMVGIGVFAYTHTSSAEMADLDTHSAQMDIDRIALELEKYHASHAEYPGSLELLIGYPIPHVMVNIRDLHHG